MNREDIKPEDCPEPWNHAVFRYCPACSYHDPICGSHEGVGWGPRCQLFEGHEGKHQAAVTWE